VPAPPEVKASTGNPLVKWMLVFVTIVGAAAAWFHWIP
jgi:hypothetical protein